MAEGLPSHESQGWDGKNGLRETGIGRVERDYRPDEINAWLESTGLPPMIPGETLNHWHDRVYSGTGPAEIEGKESD